LVGDDDTGKVDSHINMMFEIHMNVLLTIREAAEQCEVGYRTIQRWRDEKKIPVFYIKRKQFFPSEILKEFAAKQGNSKNHNRRR
jgi:excisionase family DNA binding protein